MINLAKQLKALRRVHDFTQEDIAVALHVSPQSVSKWERGECYPDIELLPALANLLDTSIDALMGMDVLRADAHRRGIFAKALGYFREGDYAGAAAELQAHLALFPSDLSAMGELALHLGMQEGAQLSQAVELAETVLQRNAPLKLQHTVRAGLCLLYAKQGLTEKAHSLAASLPHRRESREDVRTALQNTSPDALDAYLRLLVLGE